MKQSTSQTYFTRSKITVQIHEHLTSFTPTIKTIFRTGLSKTLTLNIFLQISTLTPFKLIAF